MNPTTQHPDLPEPTSEEISQTNATLEEVYGIVLSESEAKHLVMLIKELEWWDKADHQEGSHDHSTEKLAFALAQLVRGLNGKPVSHSEAREDAQVMLSVIPFQEKQRLTNEIKAILIENRPIPFEPIVLEKFSEFLLKQYGATLSEDQLEQAIQYVSRKLWLEEGLDRSLEACLDDLLSSKNTHDAVLKAFDWVVGKLAQNKEPKEMDCE